MKLFCRTLTTASVAALALCTLVATPAHAQCLPKLKIGPILPYAAHSLSTVKPTISGLSRNPKASTFVEVNSYTL